MNQNHDKYDKEVASINGYGEVRYNKRPIPHTDTINTFDNKRRRVQPSEKIESKSKCSWLYQMFCCK